MDVSKALLEDITAFQHTMSGVYISKCEDCSTGVHCQATDSASYSFSVKTNTKVASQEVDTMYSVEI